MMKRIAFGASRRHVQSYLTVGCSKHSKTIAAKPFSLVPHSRIFRQTTLSSMSTTTTTTTSTNDTNTDVATVSIDQARTVTTQALQKIGWNVNDATVQAEIMVAAELCGNNQGLVKMYQPHLMAPSPLYAGPPVIERRTRNSAVVNGNQSPGMLAAVTGADTAVEFLTNDPDNTIAVVAVHNTSTSSGQLAFYVERIARQGFIGIALANSPEFVAAAPKGRPVFGTNPLAISLPQSKNVAYPFTFDMATSAVAMFGVLSAKAQNAPLPDQVAYDRHGQWTTDATEAMGHGALATFGGHKGAGLALCVELLTSALTNAAVLGQVDSKREARNWGHLIIAVRPSALTDDFENKVTAVLDAVRASGENIRIPGERSARVAETRRKEETLAIPKSIWESVVRTAEHGLPSST